MTDSITSSSELRQFATENDGRRKIDVLASLDLHKRAANQIDLLGEHITDLQKRLAAAVSAPAGTVAPPTPMPTPVAAPVAGEEPGQAALMILQRAQDTAEQVLSEATQIRADAERTRNEADALAKAKADAALAEARGQAAHIIEAAQQRANEVAEATTVVADRAAFNQSKFRDRAAGLRADAQSVVALAESMELAATEELPATLTKRPYTEPIGQPAPVAAVPDPMPEPAAAPAPAVVAEPVAVPEPAPIGEVVLDDAPATVEVTQEAMAAVVETQQPPVPAPAPVAAELPPPPSADAVAELMEDAVAAAPADTELPPPPDPALLPPPPSVEFAAPEAPAAADIVDGKDVLDLTEGELEQVLGKSIDEELFDEDDAVIDLTEEKAATNGQGFEFFSRD